MSLMMEGWMPSVGSSSTSRRGWVDQRAGDGELLLLAAGEVAAAAAEHGFQDREQLEQLVGDVALAARGSRGKAGLEVLAHGQQREDLAALRHVGDAAPRPLVGLELVMSCAVEQDLAARCTGWCPTMARSSELLPTPLRPSTQVILPGSAADRHVPQRLRRAVVEIDALDGQHGHLSPPDGRSPRVAAELMRGNYTSELGMAPSSA